MPVRVALAGDTMLGRGVAERLVVDPGHELLAAELVAIVRETDLFVVNLECCISDRGEPVREPGQGFFFRAPPVAAERLAGLGVTCATLANNHALDFGPEALEDTLTHLESAGIATVGAGPHEAAARTPVVLQGGGLRVRVVAVTDHPSAYLSREVSRGRIDATPAAVTRWAQHLEGRAIDVAVEACTGWLFVCDALVAAGAVPHLAEPVETRALRGASGAPRPIARTRAGCVSCSPSGGCRRRGSRPSTCASGARGRGCGTR